jgi:hypothetical protein
MLANLAEMVVREIERDYAADMRAENEQLKMLRSLNTIKWVACALQALLARAEQSRARACASHAWPRPWPWPLLPATGASGCRLVLLAPTQLPPPPPTHNTQHTNPCTAAHAGRGSSCCMPPSPAGPSSS